jgi:L-aminopeptidase/D-esterase-like protein
VTLGLGRNGAIAGNGSGDIFIAFSTANPGAFDYSKITHPAMMANDQLDPVFEATVQAVEEAEVNAMVAAQTMVGRDGHKAIALPHEQLREVLKKYNRLGK